MSYPPPYAGRTSAGVRSRTTMTRRFGQDLVTCALLTWLIFSIRAAAQAVFTRISGVPGTTPDAARTSDRGTRCVPLTVTERTTSSDEPNRTHPAAAATPATARAMNATRQTRRFFTAITVTS